ncbi:MAG: histidine kinase, partial [Thermotogaceae bacterium]|nr:histidine kinase [Thermotogaceae bacterium]
MVELKRSNFEISADELIKRILRRISSEVSSDAFLFILEKYRDVFKEVDPRDGLSRTGREIKLTSNDFLRKTSENIIEEKNVILSSRHGEQEERVKLIHLSYNNEPLGLLLLSAGSEVKDSLKAWIKELELALYYSLKRSAEEEGYRRLKLVSRLTSVLETETHSEELIYKSLEIAREMLRVRWIFFL